jgi:preprotein translocase subunit SecE
MARPTRQRRRARRIERSESSLAEQARASRQASSLRAQKADVGQKNARERRRPFHSIFHFISDSWGELKKVEWPGRQQVVQGTVVVLLACAIVGGYLAIADIAFKHLVQDVLLG